MLSAKFFSPLAAVGVLASLAGTLLAPATAVSLGFGVLGAFIALLGTSREVTAAEAALFWLLTDLVRPVRSEFLRQVYAQECADDRRLSEASYESAINGLLKLRCVKECSSGSYDIRGRWIVVPL